MFVIICGSKPLSQHVRQKGEYASAAKRMEAKIQGTVNKRMNEASFVNKDYMGVQRLMPSRRRATSIHLIRQRGDIVMFHSVLGNAGRYVPSKL